jgi:3',5'-cyclic AMP phosphodiesterase CpdA
MESSDKTKILEERLRQRKEKIKALEHRNAIDEATLAKRERRARAHQLIEFGARCEKKMKAVWPDYESYDSKRKLLLCETYLSHHDYDVAAAEQRLAELEKINRLIDDVLIPEHPDWNQYTDDMRHSLRDELLKSLPKKNTG